MILLRSAILVLCRELRSFYCLFLSLGGRVPLRGKNIACRTALSSTLLGRVPLYPRGTLFPCKQALSVDFHCRVIFPCVNEIEAMYERSRMNVKVQRGSTFTYTRDTPYIFSILFTRVKFTCLRTEKLREGGNQLRGNDSNPVKT